MIFITALILIAHPLYLLLFEDTVNFGVVLPFFLGVLGLIEYVFHHRWYHFLNQPTPKHRRLKQLWQLSLYGFGVWCVSVMLFFITVMNNAHHSKPPHDMPMVLMVLGSGLRFNQATPTLTLRLETALIQAHAYPNSLIVVTGGVGKTQTISEAQVMANYLIARGITPQRIVLEDKSTSTYENFLLSKPLFNKSNQLINCIIISSDFHLNRAERIASHLGFNVVKTVGASTPLNVRYYARLREYFAFINGWLSGQF